jgi:hypothetical protein
MKLRSVLISTLGVAALAQFASPASAVTLINEDFGSGIPDGYNLPVGTTVGSFTVSDPTGTNPSGNIDLIGNGGGFDFYPGNGNYIDLNGNTPGAISSSTVTLLGNNTLTFLLGANGSGSADIFFGGVQIGSVTAGGGGSLTPQTINFGGTQAGALSFVSAGGTFGGVVLDNIQLDSTAVPEPEAFPGLLLFAGGAVMLRRKQLAKKAK